MQRLDLSSIEPIYKLFEIVFYKDAFVFDEVYQENIKSLKLYKEDLVFIWGNFSQRLSSDIHFFLKKTIRKNLV